MRRRNDMLFPRCGGLVLKSERATQMCRKRTRLSALISKSYLYCGINEQTAIKTIPRQELKHSSTKHVVGKSKVSRDLEIVSFQTYLISNCTTCWLLPCCCSSCMEWKANEHSVHLNGALLLLLLLLATTTAAAAEGSPLWCCSGEHQFQKERERRRKGERAREGEREKGFRLENEVHKVEWRFCLPLLKAISGQS